MSFLPPLEVLDKDGAIQEAAEKVDPVTRASFLRKAGVGVGAVVAGGALAGALPGIAMGQTPPQSDIDILNFALTLEYLEAAFYTEAVQMNAFQGKPRQFAIVVGSHERAHVAFLRKALATNAVARPTFDFKGTTADVNKFLPTAQTLEDTGVSAYAGQGPLIKTKSIVAAALSIHSVEARHAAWVRDIRSNGRGPNSPAPVPFDPAKSRSQVLTAVAGTGFITST